LTFKTFPKILQLWYIRQERGRLKITAKVFGYSYLHANLKHPRRVVLCPKHAYYDTINSFSP
jgi:hypothetical protein